MSRLFEALQQYKSELGGSAAADQVLPDFTSEETPAGAGDLEQAEPVSVTATPEERVVALTEPHGVGAEKLRVLGSRLRQRKRATPQLTRLLITSSIRGEGKSMVSANLAMTLAQQRQRTLLIDGDLRCPSLCDVLGTGELPGLTEWSQQEERPIGKYLRRVGSMPLWFLPAGRPAHQPGSILQHARTAQMVAEFGNQFEWVIIDSPPLPPFADSRLWAAMADAVLLVVRQSYTPKKLLQQCLDSLEPKKLLGLILNDAETVENHYYRGYYNTRK